MKIYLILAVIVFCSACNNKESDNGNSKHINTLKAFDYFHFGNTLSQTIKIRNFDTTTLRGKADKLLFDLKDNDDYSYVIINGTDTLIDMNGDGQADLLIEYYGASGTGLKNGAEIIFFNTSTKRFMPENPIALSNPTFYFTTNTVVSYYIGNGGGYANKFKWNGYMLDTLEHIDIDIQSSSGNFLMTSVIHDYTTGNVSTVTSNKVRLPAEYKYFDYKPIVRIE
ncbi:hypothetical protein SDC9_52881 [bioreactor metagenome]|uniref:Uncharacterized protein n=1 Tax=bioreactor metagenome TaxID=1076179 RepID=A0A644WRW4_9ZZZZ